MFCLKFTDDRAEQLEIEKKIDKLIQDRCNECPLLITRYLLEQREVNRKQFSDVNNVNSFNIPKKLSIVSKNMDTNMEHYNDIYNMMEKYGVCEALKRDLDNNG